MVREDLNSELLSVIDKVTQAEGDSEAFLSLLFPLLRLFEMDQAALCECVEGEIEPLFAVDNTKRILPRRAELWLSKTLVSRAIDSGMPTVHRDELVMENGIPLSVSEFSLKNIVCLPISKTPTRVIYFASRKRPLRQYSPEELQNFRIAARAACLALQQRENFTRLKENNEKLQKALEIQEQNPGTFLYASEKMASIIEEVDQLSKFDISLVLYGESGVGKEVLAREIHERSGRKGPFVAINCANLTEALLESELFGYGKGSFTGAINAKKGLLQEAEGGTFFFDEIAELTFDLQAKLLRVLQERQVRPLGTNKDIPIDVRILAASHQNLEEAVYAKKFREDLFYRLQQMTISIPPLRERIEDIELLASHFIRQFVTEFRLPERRLSQEAIEKLKTHDWPGNTRELQNVCRTAVILSKKGEISVSDIRFQMTKKQETLEIPILSKKAPVPTGGLKEMTRKYEQDLIQDLLQQGQSQSTVAETLNISVRTLQRILQGSHESLTLISSEIEN